MSKSTISEELTITGNIKGSGTIDVRGTVLGDIDTQSVDILAGGSVEGSVRVDTAHVRGRLKGSLAAQSVDLYAQANVEADVFAGSMTSEKGARVVGRVDIGGQRPAVTAAPATTQVSGPPPTTAGQGGQRPV